MPVKLKLLCEVLLSLARIEGKMAKVDDQLTAIATAVQRTSTDVQAVLDKLASSGGLTSEQSALLDQAITGLGTLDDTMEGVLGGSAGGGAGQAGRQTP